MCYLTRSMLSTLARKLCGTLWPMPLRARPVRWRRRVDGPFSDRVANSIASRTGSASSMVGSTAGIGVFLSQSRVKSVRAVLAIGNSMIRDFCILHRMSLALTFCLRTLDFRKSIVKVFRKRKTGGPSITTGGVPIYEVVSMWKMFSQCTSKVRNSRRGKRLRNILCEYTFRIMYFVA